MRTKLTAALWARQAAEQIGGVILGQEESVRWSLAAFLAGGHVLLEDIPGVGKTTLALALAKALGLSFGRVQFGPDVMPADVVGYTMPVNGKMVYQPGPVMCNLLLADELNRANSRTQAALLEAMEEGRVTVDGVCHPLPKPFVVIATQNPLGSAGTQPLPDSQLDRFALKLKLGYPSAAAEVRLLQPAGALRKIATAEELLELQTQVAETYICQPVAEYIVALVAATRRDFKIKRGASPRATLSVAAVAKALAQMDGRDFVIPEDARQAFLRCIPHRILPQGAALGRILGRVRPPKMGK